MFPPRYDDHRTIQSAESRHHERDSGHVRALRNRARSEGIISRIAGRLVSLRYDFRKRAPLAIDEHGLTDYVCRLEDGSMGRVSMRESGGEWIAVCVKPA